MAFDDVKKCCICQRETIAFHNPDPIRSADKDCCSECNRLVIRAREKCGAMDKNARAAYALYLKDRTYPQLVEELL